MKITGDALHDARIAAYALANFAKKSKARQAQLIAHATLLCDAERADSEPWINFHQQEDTNFMDDLTDLDDSKVQNKQLVESLFNLEQLTGHYMCDCAWQSSSEEDEESTEAKLKEFKSRIAV